MTQKIKEIIKDKYWIVEGQYGKIGTLRKVDGGYEFFDQNNNTKELLDSLESFKSVNTTVVSGTMQVYKGLPTNTSILYPVEHDTKPLFKKAEIRSRLLYFKIRRNGLATCVLSQTRNCRKIRNKRTILH